MTSKLFDTPRESVKSRRIALFIDEIGNHARGIAKGISLFGRNASWHFFMGTNDSSGTRIAPPLSSLRDFKGHGILAYSRNERLIEAILQTGLPVVNTTLTTFSNKVLPSVISDDFAIGQLAGQYFFNRGFRNFGYCGFGEKILWAQRRKHGFCSLVAEYSRDCDFFEYAVQTKGRTTLATQKRLCSWLKSLAKPVAIYVCSDGIGRVLAECCGQIGIRVPEEVSILGTDNDEVTCEFSNPSLSSISLAKERVGFEAARTLENLIEGAKVHEEPTFIPPIGITSRRSSDVFAVNDPNVATALNYIYHHAGDPIGVDDLLKTVPLCRRYLEIRFKNALGRSPYEEIRRAHVERAKKILVETDWSMDRIAEKSGFSDAKHFYINFRKETQMAPVQFRKRFKSVNFPLTADLDTTYNL